MKIFVFDKTEHDLKSLRLEDWKTQFDDKAEERRQATTINVDLKKAKKFRVSLLVSMF